MAENSAIEWTTHTMKYPYRFAWRNNSRRAELCGRACRVVSRGAMNSVLLEFAGGERIVTSRNAIRKRERMMAR